jgi:hypothetical protein
MFRALARTASIRAGSWQASVLLASTIIGFASISSLNDPTPLRITSKSCWIAPAEFGDIHQMHQQAWCVPHAAETECPSHGLHARLQSNQEYRPSRRCDPRLHHAKIGLQRGERIICNLRLRRGQSRNQSRLSRVRKTNQPNIGQQLQFEPQLDQFARLAFFVFGRGLVSGRGKTRVAFSAAARLLPPPKCRRGREIEKLFVGFGIVNDRAHRNRQFNAGAIFARFVATFAVAAALGCVFRIEAESAAVCCDAYRLSDDAAAMSAVATAGPPRGTNFSRRNARQPLPPSPAFAVITTSSMNNTGRLQTN